MIDFSHGLMGWNALFPLLLFAAAMVLSWLAITSFETTARTIAARATADLASVHTALDELAHRVSRLEAQVAAITERLDRGEPVVQRGSRESGVGCRDRSFDPTPETRDPTPRSEAP